VIGEATLVLLRVFRGGKILVNETDQEFRSIQLKVLDDTIFNSMG
jgi:hypothetical protein